jgi:hypothetical protein
MKFSRLSPIRTIGILAMGMLASALSGCFNPNGGTTGYFAYISTPISPKTIVISELRTGQPIFVKEIPVGKQLNFRWLSDGGTDPLYSPALLEWTITKAGNNASLLDNQMSSPAEETCKITVEIRDPEYPAPPDDERYRINSEDEPDELPESKTKQIYD